MQVLLVIGDTEVPDRLLVRADRVLRCPGSELTPTLLADVRGHIPEDVSVLGPPKEAAEAARELRRHGFPATLYANETPPGGLPAVRVRPLHDPGPPM